jgi:hypothetical protein
LLTEAQVFGKSHFKYEVGAAVTIGSNRTRILERWGLDCD